VFLTRVSIANNPVGVIPSNPEKLTLQYPFPFRDGLDKKEISLLNDKHMFTYRGVNYVEFHARSAFSFLRGASQPEHLVRAAAGLGIPGIAVLDRNGVYGSARAHHEALDQGIMAIVGAELVMEDETVLPVIAQTRTGYRNLSRVMTEALLRSPKGEAKIRWAELPEYSEGLIALTGDREGPLVHAWETGESSAVDTCMERMLQCFGKKQVYVEVQRHRIRGEQHEVKFLQSVAEKHQLPLLATNGVYYAHPDGRAVQDVFTCLRHHLHLDQAGKLIAINGERYLKSAEDMLILFVDMPEAVENTLRLADRIEFTLENLGYEFPQYPVPQEESMDSFLKKITWFGAEQRYGCLTPRIREQLNHELGLIAKLGFSGFFLIVWDIINFCRDSGIMVQGRGSAANSVVCYSLGITAADPIGGKLLFERFLSEGRKGWPDIDLDLPSGNMRESVIQKVYRRYGKHGAAMTANVITYRGRSAIREIGKVLNFPVELLNRFSDLFAYGDYKNTLQLEEQLQQAGINASHPRAPAMVKLYSMIYGLPRHLGQHNGGMIICQKQLSSVVPLENATMPGRVVVQWDKDDCEDLGLVKVDLLGLGMMAALQEAIEHTAARGHPIDLAKIPKDDPQTYELMQRADTIGVFQIESRAQMATLPRMRPKTFYDLVVEIAIIRPGPIAGNLTHPYLDRRAGKQAVDYIHPLCEPILERTLGVPLFQEQILKMAMVMADFSGSEAEELRRAMGFKRNNERMERVILKLRTALEKKKIPAEATEKIINAIGSFALYGFPESHSISFAILAYGSTYLKVHHPAEFYTSLLNNQPMGFYSPSTLIQDAKRHGLRFLPPCVVESDWKSRIIDDLTIRLGLITIKSVGRDDIQLMLGEREATPFQSIQDFLLRTDFRKDELRALANAGALNVLCHDRRSALWEVEATVDRDDLFSGIKDEEPPIVDFRLPLMSYLERLNADYQAMGLTVGAHPMGWIRNKLPPSVVTAKSLEKLPNGSSVRVAGAVICRQRPGTAKGVVFISLEDETGIANCIMYSELFEKFRLLITREPFLIISGKLQNVDKVIHVKALRVASLGETHLPVSVSYDFH
jgi:error-prone DNA polymerase